MLLPPTALSDEELSDEELLAAGGHMLVLWGNFNPLGPSLSTLMLAHTDDSEIEILVYRMLNPFRQETIALASVVGNERRRYTDARSFVRNALQRNTFATPHSTETLDLVHCVQTLVWWIWEMNPADRLIEQCFTTSPGVLADPGLRRWLELESRHRGDPWGHAGASLNDLVKGLAETVESGDILRAPEIPRAERRRLAAEWWRRVNAVEHSVPTVLEFPNAWSRAIVDNRRDALRRSFKAAMASSAANEVEEYPFARVIAFLEAFHLPLFSP